MTLTNCRFCCFFCQIAESTCESLPLDAGSLPLFAIILGFSDSSQKKRPPRAGRDVLCQLFDLKNRCLCQWNLKQKSTVWKFLKRGILVEQACALRSSLRAKPNGISRFSICFLLLTVLSPFRLMYFFEAVCRLKRRSRRSSIPSVGSPKTKTN